MECSKCKGTGLEAMRTGVPIRDAVIYQVRCKDCGRTWKEKRSLRRRRGGADKRNRWENVDFVPNSFEKRRDEEREKIDRGECPKCGSRLLTSETGRNDRNVDYETVCEGGCSFEIKGSARVDWWEEKQGGR